MSRFGSTATMYYTSGDVFTGLGTYYLQADAMPNYPFETRSETDKTVHKSKTGRKYVYQNYNLQNFTFNFSNLAETNRNQLKLIYDANPLLTFNTQGTTWGTFRFGPDSWADQEVAHELYDLNFTLEEDA